MLKLFAVIFAWLASHPAEALLLAYLALSAVNGALPTRVRTGPVGRVLHVALDRISALTRSDSPGTLKWPVIASTVIAGRPIGRDVVDVSGTPAGDTSDRPTRLPPPGPGLGALLVALVMLALAQLGCASTSAASAASATGEALAVVREVRERVCDPVVDLVVGPLQSRPCNCHCPMSGGASEPSADAGAATHPPDVDGGSSEAADASAGHD